MDRKRVGPGRKHDQEFMAELAKSLKIENGRLKSEMIYMGVAVNVNWGRYVLPIPYSHLVWFATHGCWPKEGYNLDHINDDPLDNRIENLREITKEENHKKRRGRKVNRNYGTGEMGNGFYISHDKRGKGRFYVERYLSRGVTKTPKTVRQGFGSFPTRSEAEAKVVELSKNLTS